MPRRHVDPAVTASDLLVHNYTGKHAGHQITLMKSLDGGKRAFIVAQGTGVGVDDIVVTKAMRSGVPVLVRFQVESIKHHDDGWRAYCRVVQSA